MLTDIAKTVTTKTSAIVILYNYQNISKPVYNSQPPLHEIYYQISCPSKGQFEQSKTFAQGIFKIFQLCKHVEILTKKL